jgi:cytochrome c oxidase assembly protein subunit 15
VLFGTLSIIAGVLVTGAGPHAGDAKTPRNGLDLDLWQHFHSYPGYITLGLVVVQLVSVRENRFLLRLNLGLVVALALQAIVGVIQSRLGVPGELVALHVLGSTILIALFSMQQSAIRKA